MSSLTSFNTLTATSFQPFFVRKKYIFYCENVKYSYRFKGLTYMEIYIYIYIYGFLKHLYICLLEKCLQNSFSKLSSSKDKLSKRRTKNMARLFHLTV